MKSEIINREAKSFADSIRIRKELKAYLKAESVYMRATKPHREAVNLIEQANNYMHYEELESRFSALKGENT